MTTYYLNPYGSNSNNGLGPDPTHPTNRPWLTLNKAMASGSPVAPGDIVRYPGVTFNAAGGITPSVGAGAITFKEE